MCLESFVLKREEKRQKNCTKNIEMEWNGMEQEIIKREREREAESKAYGDNNQMPYS